MNENSENQKWPWWVFTTVMVVALVCVVVLLVGLPILSVMIVDRLQPGSLDATISFWGAMFAAFISLAVTFIAGVFVFMTVKVETGAHREAREAAKGEVEREAKKIINEFIEEENGGSGVSRGEEITLQVADKYIRQVSGDDEVPKGDKLTRQAADEYLKEGIEGDGITRGEKITREVVEKFHGDDFTRMIDERVTFCVLFRQLWRKLFKSQDRPDDPNSRDTR